MPSRPAKKADPELSVRLHDAATGFSIGLALLRGATDGTASEALQILDESLARLKRLSPGVATGDRASHPLLHLESNFGREADLLGLELGLEVVGSAAWLPPNQKELLLLVVREAMRNIRRHSGVRRCQIKFDLSICPFVLEVRDWGSGLLSGTRRSSGLAQLQSLATEIGCQLSIASQPGLGTELVLVGPGCACSNGGAQDRLERP